MTKGRGIPHGLVADANVLIDYAQADRTVLALISRRVATLHVLSPVFEEVRLLSSDDAEQLGIVSVEPSLTQAMEAATGEGTMSFQDRLCLVVARDAGWAVFSNDKALRSACREAGIGCMWGMEAMALLVEERHLGATRAMNVATRIAAHNPFITKAVMDRFRNRIGL